MAYLLGDWTSATRWWKSCFAGVAVDEEEAWRIKDNSQLAGAIVRRSSRPPASEYATTYHSGEIFREVGEDEVAQLNGEFDVDTAQIKVEAPVGHVPGAGEVRITSVFPMSHCWGMRPSGEGRLWL